MLVGFLPGAAITGAGTSTCEMFVRASRGGSQAATEATFAWVQGWFSARNMRSLGNSVSGSSDKVSTVGGGHWQERNVRGIESTALELGRHKGGELLNSTVTVTRPP